MRIIIFVKQISLKMHPQPNLRILSFLVQLTLLSICFPGFFCQNNSEYAQCIRPFQCGRLRNIIYPFWGGGRPLSCGYPGFELMNCDGDFPLLNVSSLSYRVLEIDFSNYTLKVARQDLWNNTCPQVLRNTTLDPYIFKIPFDSGDSNVNLYYDCTDNRGKQITLQNQFKCDVDGDTTVNVFNAGNASSGPGSNITCNKTISVPVNQTAAKALETPMSSSINVLRSALTSGFFVIWSADNANCDSCRRSGGTCGYNNQKSSFARVPTGFLCQKSDETPSPLVIVAPGGPTQGVVPVVYPVNNGSTRGSNRSYAVPPASPPSAARPASPPSAAPDLSSPESSGQVGIIIGVVLGITGIIIFIIVLVCYFQRRCLPGGPKQVSDKDIEKFLLQHGSLAPRRYKYSEIKKITKSFSDKLGQGGYGSVYKGMLPDGSPVAVKVLTEINSKGEEFVNEVACISRTSHVNVVNLLGFCYDGNKRALVYEFMPNRSLDKFISNSGSTNAQFHLDLYKLYMIAVGVAKGLEYLHTGCSTRIVHFDIKPQNILLDEDFWPKISDFGLAKLCKKKQSILSLIGRRGTIGYIAPEIFSRNFGGVSYKSDVYSYGMMVLEMAGANRIGGTEGTQSSENYFPDKVYELVTQDTTRKLDDFVVEEEQETAKKLFLVGFWCIQTTPSERPSMSEVVEMLEGSLHSIEIPPKPVLFTPALPADQELSPSLSVYTETQNLEEVTANG